MVLVLAAAIGATAQSAAKIFKGYISGTPVQFSLTRDGSKLSGSYFYTRVGKPLKLNGTIDADGNFKLTETDDAGKKTGEFSGQWKDDPSVNGVTLEGNWRKPDSTDDLGFSAAEQNIDFSSGLSLTSKSFSEKNKPKRFSIDVEYPELAGANSPYAAKFNLAAKTVAMSEVAEFRKDMMSMTAADLKSMPSAMNNYLDVGYSVEWATNEIISLQFTNSTFTGGVHPNYYSKTLNYDLKNGRELKLSDVFLPSAKYLKFVSDYSIAELKTKLGDTADLETINIGAGAKAENYQNWNLTKKGLEFTFDPYQVASYAEGQQIVIIPYANLKNLMRKDGIAAQYLK